MSASNIATNSAAVGTSSFVATEVGNNIATELVTVFGNRVTSFLTPATLGQSLIQLGTAVTYEQLKRTTLAQLDADANEIRNTFLEGLTQGDTSASALNSLAGGWNLVQSARTSVLRDIALKKFAASAIINTITVVSLATGVGGVVAVARGGSTTLFRAVSRSELDDIVLNGLRASGGKTGFETGKLFATTLDDAVKFGKNNFKLDKLLGVTKPNHIIRVQVPNSVLKSSTILTTDSLTAVFISAERLHLLKATALKYSPFF